MNQYNDKLNMDDITKLLGVDSLSNFDDRIMYCVDSGAYSFAFKEAKSEGKSDEEAEELAMKAESEEQSEYSNNYYDAVMFAAEWLFGKHGLQLHPVKVKGKEVSRPWEYKVIPSTSWDVAFTSIRETINGVGMFDAYNAKEFMKSTCCTTARQCVLMHLHWMRDYCSIFGESSISSIIDRRMR